MSKKMTLWIWSEQWSLPVSEGINWYQKILIDPNKSKLNRKTNPIFYILDMQHVKRLKQRSHQDES